MKKTKDKDFENFQKLPLAHPVLEKLALGIYNAYFPMSPEEYIARYAHTIGCSNFDEYRYQNQDLHYWVHRSHEILRDHEKLKKIQSELLTPEEIKAIEIESLEF